MISSLEFFVLVLGEMNCPLDVVSGEEFFAKDGRLGVVSGVVFDVCLFGLWRMKDLFAVWFRRRGSRFRGELAGKLFRSGWRLWVVGRIACLAYGGQEQGQRRRG